ncbi:hypothetical protein PR202_gb12639 [Eleusine coracana subsp. coracana]|uniref:Uncharacterized protein n=1 Tax=Eleusine coracana subsp. coracana TaxID=191504 RepID=A0AAV5END1_ELECO|nr:hypothetical protein PR202_gb12639 [Eleusine coracana subsp. coracana]
MTTPQETLDPEPSAPPAQAPTPAAVEQGRLPEASDSVSCPIPTPEPSTPPAAAVPAGAQLEDPKPSSSPVAGAQLEDPKPSASPAAGAQLEDPTKPSVSPAAGAQLEDPKPSAAVVSQSAAVKRPWLRPRLRPMIKLASWPVRRVLHGMGRACDILVVASRQPVVVRCVAKMSTLVPDRMRGAVSRVLRLFDSLSLASQELPISDPVLEHSYFEPDMERVRVVVLVVVAAGTVLFITLEVLVIAGFVTRYDQYVGILRNFVGFLQSLLESVSKISDFYNNVMWHRAEAARMLQEAAEQKLKVPTPAAKQQLQPPATEQQLPPLAPEQQLPPPATEQQVLPPTIELLPPPATELLIPTPPPPAMDMC